MAKIENVISTLKKLCVKRRVLDKKIVDVEKMLITEIKKSAKPVPKIRGPVKKKIAEKE